MDEFEREDNVTVIDEEKTEIKPPRKYKVVLVNDDFTPMDFVVSILESYFHKSTSEAVQIMMVVHQSGKAVAGIYTKDIAETKAMQVTHLAQNEGHPLLCTIEPE